MKTLMTMLVLIGTSSAFAGSAKENFKEVCLSNLKADLKKGRIDKAETDKFCGCYAESLAKSCGAKCDNLQAAASYSWSNPKAMQEMKNSCSALEPKTKKKK